MKCFITGVTGQDGRLLADNLVRSGAKVFGTSRLSQIPTDNFFQSLHSNPNFEFFTLDTTNYKEVHDALDTIQPNEIYHLSGQSSVGKSFSFPYETYISNTTSTLILLEFIRKSRSNTKMFNAVSSDIFGESPEGSNAKTEHNPLSPYALAKSNSAKMLESYRDLYDLYAVNAYLFNHESIFRSDQFVTHKIIQTAKKIASRKEDEIVLGNTSIVRDWGWAPEIVEAFPKLLRQTEVFDLTIGTGRSISLHDFGVACFEYFGLNFEDHVKYDQNLTRKNEIKVSRCDTRDAQIKIKWSAEIFEEDVAKKLSEALCRPDLP